MPKTNKELTTEIVCSFINAWGINDRGIPPQQEELPEFIQSIYDTICRLDDTHKETP